MFSIRFLLAFCIVTVQLALPLPGGGAAAEEKATSSRYECLATPEGIPRKVIVKKEAVEAFANEDFTGATKPLRFFRKYFVFKDGEKGFLVGEATYKASVLGWVRKEHVLPWDTEQAAFFINKKAVGRQPMSLWPMKEDVGKAEKPRFQETLDRDQTTEPFPILGKDGPMVQLAVLWSSDGPLPVLKKDLSEKGDNTTATTVTGDQVDRDPTGQEAKPAPGGKQEASQLFEQAKRMDVVIVIDVTGSMGPYIEEVRKRLIDIVNALGKMAGPNMQTKVNVGIVAYRDYADKLQDGTFVTKVQNLTNESGKVVEFLKGLSPRGGAGNNEAVCDALFEAASKMSWGERGYKVLCLVGDAPPHTDSDDDIAALKASGTAVDSPFFGRPFEESLRKVKDELSKNSIRVYSLGVGDDPEMKSMFKQFVSKDDMFLSLANAEQFIKALETELRESRTEHVEALKTAEEVIDGEKELSSLSDSTLETLRGIGIEGEMLEQLNEERIQTGWFNVREAEENVAVCVYLRRADIEEWAITIREALQDYGRREPEILKLITSMSVGKEIKPKGVGDLANMARALAAPPDMLKASSLGMEEKAKVANLYRKLSNILILSLTDHLFNKYDEGWVPVEYLPGSLKEFTKPAGAGGK